MAAENKPKILFLDDEKFLLRVYKLSFEQQGFEVTTCSDVDDALGLLRKGYEPDMILFDITMPDSRSGYEFIEAIHKEKLGKRALKYALTNEGQEGPMMRLKELGADGHFLKVRFVPPELAREVASILKSRERSMF